MKSIAILLVLLSTGIPVFGQDTKLIGKWDIVEFTILEKNEADTQENADPFVVSRHDNELKLRKDSSVWTLDFKPNGKITQTSNMRDGSMESWNGTWSTESNELILILNLSDEQMVKIVYKFDVEGNNLTLKRLNPMKTMIIGCRFRKV